MSYLFIAEKPSLGRAIAEVLPKPHRKEEGAVRCGNGDVVTWCIGHLLEQVEPDDYDPVYKKWDLQLLPIVPEKWRLKPRKSASKQLAVVRKLLKEPLDIVHAGDPDREGQLLVDEVLEYCRVSQKRRAEAQRLLINDLNAAAVNRALQQLRPNRDFIPLSVSALARSRADWLYGMNMTRAYTLLGQKAGYNGVLSVGRVQTPVLGLVVRRDEEIEQFTPVDYFTLHAIIPYSDGKISGDIRAKWKPGEACEPWQDSEGRVLSHRLAENVQRRITGQPATVTESVQKTSKQNPPLPYSLSALQIDAARKYNLSAQKTLDTCQSLYEKHKLITYPRSDCRYLPEGHFYEAGRIADAIQRQDDSLQQAVSGADMRRRSKAWNDRRVEAHHAIIPTGKVVSSGLTDMENKVYHLIAAQYLVQFWPAADYSESRLKFDIGGGTFISSGRTLVAPGWKTVLGGGEKNPDQNAFIPPLKKGTELICREGEISQKKTEPPARFTEASLLTAMTGIARFVSDPGLKAILKETDGLGTEATRAGMIDILIKRQLMSRQGKQIHSQPAGRALIHALPDSATFPDMTAHWEKQLQDMAEKAQAYQPFMAALTDNVQQLMDRVRTGPVPEAMKSLSAHSPAGGKKSFRKKKTGARRSSGRSRAKATDSRK